MEEKSGKPVGFIALLIIGLVFTLGTVLVTGYFISQAEGMSEKNSYFEFNKQFDGKMQ